MYRIPYISNKRTVLYWIWEASFSTRVHRWRPRRRRHRALPVYECGKRSFPYSINAQFFCLKYTISNLYNNWTCKYNEICMFWVFQFSFFFSFFFFYFVQKINLYFKGTPGLLCCRSASFHRWAFMILLSAPNIYIWNSYERREKKVKCILICCFIVDPSNWHENFNFIYTK